MRGHETGLEEARAWATSNRKKRPRISAEELRKHLLATAVGMLTKSGGLTVSLAHLNMEELIRIADVPRSSVYREWESKEAFYVDLMEKMIEPTEEEGAAFDAETLSVCSSVVKRYQDRLSTAAGRRQVLREAVRLGVARTFDAVSHSLSWSTATALVATLPALDDTDRDRVLAALTKAEVHFVDRMAEFYEGLIPILGLRLKEQFSIRVFSATGSSVIEGLIGRSLTNPQLVNTPIILPGIDGEPVEWHLAAVGFLAILDAMVEPDPDWNELAVKSAYEAM